MISPGKLSFVHWGSFVSGKTSVRNFALRFLIVVGAAVCCFVVNEANREAHREKLIAELEAKGATWYPPRQTPDVRKFDTKPRSWRERLGAGLRRKPAVPQPEEATLPKEITKQQMRQFLNLFPSLRIIRIDGSSATPEVLDALASYSTLQRFEIDNPAAINDETVPTLARIKCADGIALTNQQCTDDALTKLAAAGIRIEEYSGPDHWRNVGDDGLKATAKFLDNLYVWANCRGTDDGINALAGHPMLSVLRINGPNYGDASAETVSKLPRLIQLHIAATSHTDAGLAKLIHGCGASYIELRKVAVGDRTIVALHKAPEIMTLSLVDVDLTVAQCDAIATLPISGLELKGAKLTDDHISALSPLAEKLASFALDAPQVTDTGLWWLGYAEELASLRLDNTQATVAIWIALPHPNAIHDVGMGGPYVVGQKLSAIQQVRGGRSLKLTGEGIDDDMVTRIPKWFDIVTLRNTHVTANGLLEFISYSGVKWINLEHDENVPTWITPDDAKNIEAATKGRVKVGIEVLPSAGCE